MQVYKNHTYSTLLNEYRDALSWYASQGIDVRINRFRTYEKLLLDMLALKLPESVQMYEKRYQLELVNAIYELDILIYIHKSLEGSNIPGLKQKIKAIRKGPDSYADEKGNKNYGRNIVYELVVASTLYNCDYVPNISTLADVSTMIDGQTIFVECKRPQSNSNIEDLVKGGFDQLSDRLLNFVSQKAYGILFISLDKLLNPNAYSTLYDKPEQYYKELFDVSKKILSDILERTHHKVHKRVPGIVAEMRLPVKIKKESFKFGTGHFGLWMKIGPSEDVGKKVFENLAHDYVEAGNKFLKKHPFEI